MSTAELLSRARELEAEGQAGITAALLVRELSATLTITTPTGGITVPDHHRRMAAVEAIGEILGPNG